MMTLSIRSAGLDRVVRNGPNQLAGVTVENNDTFAGGGPLDSAFAESGAGGAWH